ncbi:Tigger transposable element-derived protein 4 [Pseudolycoriella hygida]|uniref:Tigger transposable element-derived protein 4 n=1 Tax=Pseudolycoriella hygida TaxID=35572 RepID=A0A9Q0S2K2_9DIPT|nr:Tigger transposable element-derived protein 4 [Pseudolycoriella hygida]
MAQNANIPLTGAIVHAKARVLTKHLNITNFKASDGWVTKFTRRHNFRFKTMSGESADVDDEAVNDWFHQLLRANDIFNVDETGLFFKCLPTKILAYRNEKCYGGKHSKVRVSVLVGATLQRCKFAGCCHVFGQAWNEVKQKTIANCFKHVRITNQWEAEFDLPLSLLRNLIRQPEPITDVQEAESLRNTVYIENWNRIKDSCNLNISFDDYIGIDEHLPTEDLPSDEELLTFLSMNKNDD